MLGDRRGTIRGWGYVSQNPTLLVGLPISTVSSQFKEHPIIQFQEMGPRKAELQLLSTDFLCPKRIETYSGICDLSPSLWRMEWNHFPTESNHLDVPKEELRLLNTIRCCSWYMICVLIIGFLWKAHVENDPNNSYCFVFSTLMLLIFLPCCRNVVNYLRRKNRVDRTLSLTGKSSKFFPLSWFWF